MSPVLPPPREPGHYRVAMVCLGNICRSPMADVVLESKVAAARLAERGLLVDVVSCGTGDWHVGHPMDDRAAATLSAAGYDPSRHRAQQFATSWLDEHDVLLAMDQRNLADIGGRTERTLLFRDLDPQTDPQTDPRTGSEREPGAEVPDPYYGGDRGFQEVLQMVERCCDAIVLELSDLADQPGR